MTDDNRDFNQIYADYQPGILRYLTQLAGVRAAEDLTQETFIRVGQALGSFNHQSSLSTWIYKIATNAATDRLRSRAFRQETVTVYHTETGHCPESSADSSFSTEEQVIRKEMNECIHAYVDLLPENYRTVLILSEMEGFRNSEIADILGISLDTVKIRLHRAREKLRQELGANCIFYRNDCNQLACESKGPIPQNVKQKR
jgi:RNA polymerase sigma-70 factor, ECF subfamily